MYTPGCEAGACAMLPEPTEGSYDCANAGVASTSAAAARTFRRWSLVGQLGCRIAVRSGHGLWEVRSNLAGGRIARVIFCIAGGEMILLHGFLKTTQKTPPNEIKLALGRKREIGE